MPDCVVETEDTERIKVWAPLVVAGGVKPANVWAMRFGEEAPGMGTLAMKVPAPQVKETSVLRVKLDRSTSETRRCGRSSTTMLPGLSTAG